MQSSQGPFEINRIRVREQQAMGGGGHTESRFNQASQTHRDYNKVAKIKDLDTSELPKDVSNGNLDV